MRRGKEDEEEQNHNTRCTFLEANHSAQLPNSNHQSKTKSVKPSERRRCCCESLTCVCPVADPSWTGPCVAVEGWAGAVAAGAGWAEATDSTLVANANSTDTAAAIDRESSPFPAPPGSPHHPHLKLIF